jgi:SAM-dependent methyltransferase
MTAPEDDDRDRDAQRFAAAALAAEDPTGWFEHLYAAAGTGEAIVPWDGGTPNRYLVEWVDRERPDAAGRRALVVGCGFGDDSEYVAAMGFDTDAFDIAPSAIAEAGRRYPDSPVRYRVADLLDPPPEWHRAFDLIVEIYTLQALPDPPRRAAAARLAGMVAPGGTLLLIGFRQDPAAPDEPPPPWPLRRADIDVPAAHGLRAVNVEELAEVSRWRVEYRRDSD